jgi:hypothetical protein
MQDLTPSPRPWLAIRLLFRLLCGSWERGQRRGNAARPAVTAFSETGEEAGDNALALRIELAAQNSPAG